MIIKLEPVNDNNREAVLALSVREDQPFVAPNDYSLNEAEETKIRVQFAEDGLEITDLTPEELEVFKARVRPLREQLKKKYGAEACKAFRIDIDEEGGM